ncbi:unnamed protein product [Parajaminaea phylloscopi]
MPIAIRIPPPSALTQTAEISNTAGLDPPRRSSRRSSAKAAPLVDGPNSDDDSIPATRSTSSIARKASRKIAAELSQEEARADSSLSPGPESDAPAEKPKRKARAKRVSKEEADEPAPKGRKRKAPVKNEDSEAQSSDKSMLVDDEPELDSDGEPVRRAKNGRKLPKKKPKKEKVYVIPDVEKRDFRQEFRAESSDAFSSREARKGGFVGRLGYACLNTVLRSADPPVFSSRTARIKTIEEKGLDWVKDLARQNARDIVPMLQWNAAHNIRFMRLSSEIFPFASHDKYGYSPECAKEELEEAGRVARSLNHRVTMHPGQFVQLGSPNEAVVKASIRELEVHAAVLDLMGMDQDSVMIIHGGGVYQDRPATLERMKATLRSRLPDFVRNRLVLENDEISWSAEELLPVCRELNIPMVFDFHHDMLRPSKASPRELMPELLGLFKQRGIRPKFHLSHPRPGSRNLRERRAHSDRCGTLPLDLPPDADLMIEAKDKEQAVFELYRVYDLYPVEHSVLRPPADDITTATSGRRKVLNGSGGASSQQEDNEGVSVDGENGSPAPQRKKRENETDKLKRAIEHSKKIAAKRGVEYTGPEYTDPAEARRLAGPILGTAETMAIMEVEAQEIREELKRHTGRALSEIREDVEKRVEGHGEEDAKPPHSADTTANSSVLDEHAGGSGDVKPPPSDLAAAGLQTEGATTSGTAIPMREIVQDPSEHSVPGEEEKVPYEPVSVPSAAPITPAKPAIKPENEQGGANVTATVIVPTSADRVDKYL